MKLFKSLFLFFVLFNFYQNSLFACSCSPHTYIEDYEDADVIFIGKVTDIQYIYKWIWIPKIELNEDGYYVESKDSIEIQHQVNLVYFEVTRRIKNMEVLERVEVVTNILDSACGYHFEKGESYILYGYNFMPKKPYYFPHSDLPLVTLPGKHFSTSMCTGTTHQIKNGLNQIEQYWADKN